MISKSGGIWYLKGSKKPFTRIGYILSDTSGKKITESKYLDGNYTVFGKVLNGMDVVDNIMKVSVDFRDNPIERVEMEISICN